jgi:hypothetical protein
MGMRKIKLKLRAIPNSSKPPKSCVSASAQLRFETAPEAGFHMKLWYKRFQSTVRPYGRM